LRKVDKRPKPFKRFRYGDSIYLVRGWKSTNELLIKKEIACLKIPFDIENRTFAVKFPVTDNLGFTIFKILE